MQPARGTSAYLPANMDDLYATVVKGNVRHFALLSLAGACVYWMLKRAYIAHFHPLAKLPGPYLNRWTSWPLSLANMAGRRVMYIEELRYIYGPYVRIAPLEVAINDLAAVKEVHKMGSRFLKPHWYELSTGEDGNPGMFAMRSPKDHGARRKMFAKQFSKLGVLKFGELLQEKFALATQAMSRHAIDGKIDLMVWWAYLATDLLGEMAFGESFNTLDIGQPSQYNKDMQQTSFIAGLRAEFPAIVRFLWNMPIPSIVAMKEASDRVQDMGADAFIKYRKAEKLGNSKTTIFTELVDKDIDPALASNESKNLLIAGSDTTMVTLTYLIWIIIKHPEVREKLLKEIDSLPAGYSITDAENLPYLQNVVQESLRLYGAGPGSLPRAAPSEGVVFDGYYLSSDTIVSTQAFVMHRDASIYVKPLDFIPERWDAPTQAMKDAFMPFGGGSRICLGQHLARLEMLLAAIEFFKAFPKASIAVETTEESMAFQNYFLVQPVSHRCIVSLF